MPLHAIIFGQGVPFINYSITNNKFPNIWPITVVMLHATWNEGLWKLVNDVVRHETYNETRRQELGLHDESW